MQNATSVALSRLVAQQRAMDVTATNLANANTPGFKTGRTLFADWLSHPSPERGPGARRAGAGLHAGPRHLPRAGCRGH